MGGKGIFQMTLVVKNLKQKNKTVQCVMVAHGKAESSLVIRKKLISSFMIMEKGVHEHVCYKIR